MKGGLFRMDKKKLVILIPSIIVILLLISVGVFFILNNSTEKPNEKPNDEEVVKEEDLDKFKEVDFNTNMNKNKNQAISEIVEDEKEKEERKNQRDTMSFLELAVPVQVAIITASIGAITLFLNTIIGKLNLTSLKQRRYIDTISKERIEWLNKIRDSFVEYTTLTSELTLLVTFYDLGKMKVEDEKGQKYIDKLLQLEGVKQKIYLLLNPKEVYAAKLNLLSDEATKLLLKYVNTPIADNGDELNNLNTNINFIQQVILKAEWKRIIIEIEKGKKLKPEKVDRIFIEVAEKIDKERNKKIFSEIS